MKEISFETLDLLATLGNGRKNAKPIVLLARQMDVTKRKVLKMIATARDELEDSNILIMNTGHGSYYKQEAIGNDSERESDSLLSMFGA